MSSAPVQITSISDQPPVWGWVRVRALVIDSVTSPHSRRVYATALDDFRRWSEGSESRIFNRETVQQYRVHLEARGMSASTEGRWVLVDIEGKGKRVRNAPMPTWAKDSLDRWTVAADIRNGRLFRAIAQNGNLGKGLSPQAVYLIVRGHAEELGIKIAPHDLRRTFAKLAHRGDAPLEQIQLSLGHESIVTTERYLDVQQNLADAPCDHLGIELENL